MIKKPLRVLITVTGIIALFLEVCVIGWNIVRLQSSLQNVYFMEYVNGTTVYKYDVRKGKTVVVAVLEGDYSDCKINRTENYIIGEFCPFRTDNRVLLRYNLSDGTTEEITGKEAEIIKERIKEAEDKLLERRSFPEEAREIENYRYFDKQIGWSLDGEKAAFSDYEQENIYLYNVNTDTCECVLTAGWNRTFGSNVGLDAGGRYIFYENNFNYLFNTADVKIMIYDTQTGRRTKIFGRRYTQNVFEFVQDLDF